MDETKNDEEIPEKGAPACGNEECRQMHCGRCGGHSGSMGHFGLFCRARQRRTAPHQCCPEPAGCELPAHKDWHPDDELHAAACDLA